MHVKELDTISLIKLCGEDTGSYAAWQELFFRFSEKIKIYVARNCLHAHGKSPYLSSQISLIPEQEVDDLVQQVFLRILDRDCWLLKQFHGTEEDFCACLAFLARSVVYNHYRDLRRKKRPPIEHSLDELAKAGTDRSPAEPAWAQHPDDSLEEALLRTERIAQIYAALRYQFSSAEDSDKAIIIFELYFLQGYTEEEISKCKGINLSQPSVSRIIASLKCCLKRYAKRHSSKDSR